MRPPASLSWGGDTALRINSLLVSHELESESFQRRSLVLNTRIKMFSAEFVELLAMRTRMTKHFPDKPRIKDKVEDPPWGDAIPILPPMIPTPISTPFFSPREWQLP